MAVEARDLIGTASIVVVGNFNPSILHPDWFDRHGIMPAEEIAGLFAEPVKKEIPELGATIEFSSQFIVTQDSALINFKSFVLKVTRDRFEVSCRTRDKFPLMINALRKVFSILGETPITAYGINFTEIVKVQDKNDVIVERLFPTTREIKDIFGETCSSEHIVKTKINKNSMSFAIGIDSSHENSLSFKINNHFENESFDAEFLVGDILINFDFVFKFCEVTLQSICGQSAERITS